MSAQQDYVCLPYLLRGDAGDRGGHLRGEAAAVLLAKKYDTPFEDILDQLKERVMKKK
jgi:hypothetical protein